MLRSHKSRREQSIDAHVPEPIITREDGANPEQEAILADSVGLALLVALETLAPAQRLAFVLHDVFDVPFNEIASIVGCTSTAARQLASRARRQVRGATISPDVDLKRQREVVDAFLAAARNGDFDGLLAVLDPDIVLRADSGALPRGASKVIRGARAVAEQAQNFSRVPQFIQPVLVNGAAGIVSWLPDGRPFSILEFTVVGEKIVGIYILADPNRLRDLDLTLVNN